MWNSLSSDLCLAASVSDFKIKLLLYDHSFMIVIYAILEQLYYYSEPQFVSTVITTSLISEVGVLGQRGGERGCKALTEVLYDGICESTSLRSLH